MASGRQLQTAIAGLLRCSEVEGGVSVGFASMESGQFHRKLEMFLGLEVG